jgi:ABC-type transport system involved in multi-copper enzyme maturation permease subunit
MAIRRALVLAHLNVLENARKQVFHVLVLATIVVIFSSTLLSFFTLGVQVKVLKDLCLASIMLSAGMIAIALAAGAIPADIEAKTAYPILARPIRRWEYVLGKYLGVMATTAISVLVMSVAFAGLLFRYQHSIDLFMVTAVGFVLLEAAVISAITILLSTFAGSVPAAVVSFLIYILGTVKIGYLGSVLHTCENPVVRMVGQSIYHLLPNLECFSFKDALVHGVHAPTPYLVLVAAYGLCYSGFAVVIAGVLFARREL